MTIKRTDGHDSFSEESHCCCSFPSCLECRDGLSKQPLHDQDKEITQHTWKRGGNRSLITLHRGVFLLAVIGAGCLVASYGIFAFSPIDIIISQRMRIQKGSTLYNLWEKPPVDVYIKVFVFNITNADEFLSGKEKLRVQEVGPYFYREILENTNVTFNPNNTISYVPKRSVMAVPDMSPRNAHTDRIIVPNVALLGMASMLHNSSAFLNVGLATLARYVDAQPLLNLSVHEYLWGYDDPLVRLASTFLPSWISFPRLGLMDRMFDEGENLVTMRLDNSAVNKSDAFTRQHKIYSIDSFNGKPSLRQWEDGTSCSSLQGVSEGVLYPRHMTQNDTFLIYRKAFCRVIPVVFSHSGVTESGFPAYWFRLPNNVFDSPDKNPENSCYCHPKVAPCLLSGLADITPCYYSIPVALSFPHFLHGDPRLVDMMDGLSPDPSKHDSFIMLQPNLGLPMAVSTRMQLNLVVHNTRHNPRVAIFNNYTLPIFWLDWYFEIPGVVTRLFYMVLLVAPALQTAAIVLFALLGVAMLGLAACSCSKKNTTVATKIISKSQHLLEKNAGEQLLSRTQQRPRLSRRR